MLVNMKGMLLEAVSKDRIVPAFNVFGYEDAKVVIEVAEELNAPVILMTNRDAAKFMGLKYYGALYKSMAQDSEVDVCLHLDHGQTKEEVVQAIQAGYTSVMYDGSSLPIEENIKKSNEISKLCNACNISFEVEVGCVAYNEPDKMIPERLTEVEDIKSMIEKVETHGIAVAVGNVHKMKEQKAVIDFERLSILNNQSRVPLVIHGSSGIPDDQIIRMRRYGIGKMNVGTSVRMAFGNTLRVFAQDNPKIFDRIKMFERPMEEMKKVIKNKYNLLGWE